MQKIHVAFGIHRHIEIKTFHFDTLEKVRVCLHIDLPMVIDMEIGLSTYRFYCSQEEESLRRCAATTTCVKTVVSKRLMDQSL